MGNTTLSIDQETRERLNDYEAEGHDSMGDVLNGLMNIVPEIETIYDGCTNCDKKLRPGALPEQQGGIIQWFSHEVGESRNFHSTFFCSPACAKEAQDKVDKQVPRHPDIVRVGGHEEMVAELPGGEFMMDTESHWVGFDIPCGFTGTDDHGNEANYVGEPVYLKNEGDWVQSAVVDEIINEETYTTLTLGTSVPTEMLNHPDEERREQYKEKHQERGEAACPHCDARILYAVEIPPNACPKCKEEIEEDYWPESDDDEESRA